MQHDLVGIQRDQLFDFQTYLKVVGDPAVASTLLLAERLADVHSRLGGLQSVFEDFGRFTLNIQSEIADTLFKMTPRSVAGVKAAQKRKPGRRLGRPPGSRNKPKPAEPAEAGNA